LLKRLKNKLFSEAFDDYIQKIDSPDGADPNNEIERRLGALIQQDINNAEQSKKDTTDETGLSIEEIWEDEYKMAKGGGLQWSTNMAYRNQRDRIRRPNSEDNFIHPAIEIQVANLTATPIEPTIKGKKEHEEHAQKITHMARFNDYRNNFDQTWKEIVRDFVSYGPAIVKVCWDGEWIGGKGPDRYVGEVKVEHINHEDFLVDPSIINLDRDLQTAQYIGFKSRQKVDYIAKRWEQYGKYVFAEVNDDYLIDEGIENETTNLYEMYYKGFPEYMPKERAKELRERAMLQEEQGDYYKSRDLLDMANGDLEGVHLAYYCNDILLEYIPYVYDNGKYPVAFRTRYRDRKCQWGYGEIRNIKIPQLLHNKADEIEIEAMVKEGLGGGYYQSGSIDAKQLDNIVQNGAKSGMWFPVNNLQGIKERTGVKVPPNISGYKEHKQRMVETISSNTAISQGMSPSASMPFKAIAALGERTDIKTKSAAHKLRDLIIEVNKLRIDLFSQFYTEDRYYRYVDSQNNINEGTFRNDEIFDVWSREMQQKKMIDPNTGEAMVDPTTGEPMQQQVELQEYFVPEFDVDVDIISKKPNDREYYTNIAFQLHQLQILSPEDLLFTLEEGRLPETADIIEHLHARNQLSGMTAQIQQLPQDMQDVAVQNMAMALQQTVQGLMGQIQGKAQQQLPPPTV
jgi:hypothetical protein